MERKNKEGIKSFIQEINPMLKVEFQEWDLECDVFDEIVYVGKTYDKRTDRYFRQFVNELNPECARVNLFLLSLLHEIGHIETWDDEIADEKDAIYGLLKMQFDDEENLDDAKMKEYCDLYYRIPLEQNATEWGIEFALSHMDLMKKYEWLNI